MGTMAHEALIPVDSMTAVENEYFIMDGGGLDHQAHEMRQEQSFVLNSEMGDINVTLSDLISVGVPLDGEVINVHADHVSALLKLVQSRKQVEPQFNDDAEYPSTSASGVGEALKAPENNLYAYIGDEGSVALIEDKTQKQVAKFDRQELEARFGIVDATQMSQEELERLVQSAFNRSADGSASKSTVRFAVSSQQEIPSTSSVNLTSIRPSKAPFKRHRVGTSFIGETVDVVSKKFATSKQAIIRYARKNGTFKVQYESGQFEWVDSSRIISYDREKFKPSSYSTKTKEPADECAEATNNTKSHLHTPDNCALCEKKIEGKPAFIVIRIPACRGCATSKKLVVEDLLAIRDEPSPKRPTLEKKD